MKRSDDCIGSQYLAVPSPPSSLPRLRLSLGGETSRGLGPFSRVYTPGMSLRYRTLWRVSVAFFNHQRLCDSATFQHVPPARCSALRREAVKGYLSTIDSPGGLSYLLYPRLLPSFFLIVPPTVLSRYGSCSLTKQIELPDRETMVPVDFAVFAESLDLVDMMRNE